jgi:hypothetical protein
LVGALLTSAPTAVQAKSHKTTSTKHASESGHPTLHLDSIDLARREVLVEVSGLGKAPLANLFTFTDDRGRHYIAINVHCDAPASTGLRVCELEIPVGYERHRVVSLGLHLHGLHGREIVADTGEVEQAWRAALKHQPARGEMQEAGSNRPVVEDSEPSEEEGEAPPDGGAPSLE